MSTFAAILLFALIVLLAVSGFALSIICARKKNIYKDRQSVFYRKRGLISLASLLLAGAAVALPFFLKNAYYDGTGLLGAAFVISAILGIVTVVFFFANIPPLKDFPKVDLAEEDIAFFRDAFTDMFTRILKYSNETIDRLKKEAAGVPEHRARYILRCVGYFLKQLLFNTLFTRFTGTDPMYLDSGVFGFMKYGRYALQNPVLLACSAAQELIDGTQKALEKLQSADTEDLRKTLSAFFAVYNDLKKNDSSVPENRVCHAAQIARFLSAYLWTLQEKTMNKIEVIYTAFDSNLGIPVNLYREIVTVIECRNREPE